MQDEDARMEDRMEARLTELEIKASYSEDLLDRLNEVVVRQQAQIDALQRALLALREQALAEPGTASQPGLASLRDELPPHY
ncbi:SlyX protein [beta proteobacterium AAP51]|nr:SlyX protein [beta proteobacterium AAP51]